MTSREQKLQRVIDNDLRLGFTERQVKEKPNDTTMVGEGAKRLPPSIFQFSADKHVVAEWRLLSGRAHGNIWPVHYSDTRPVQSADPRFVTAPVAMSLDRMLGSVHTALTMVNCAVDHFSEQELVVADDAYFERLSISSEDGAMSYPCEGD